MQPIVLVMYCAQNRCIWCQFEFRDGQDKIRATLLRYMLGSENKPLSLEPLGEFVYSAQGIAIRQVGAYAGRAVHENHIRFHGFHDTSNARSATFHNIRTVICAHVHCENLVNAQAMAPFSRLTGLAFHLSRPLDSFPVSPFLFPPPVQEERRRADYVQSELAKNLGSDFPGRLPFEIWLKISAHFFQECATLTAVERVRARARNKADRPMIIDLSGSKPVYASYVKIDGKRYVKSLHHNVPPAVCPKDVVTVPIYRAGKETWRRLVQRNKRGGLHLFLAHDHVGIRQAFIASVTDIDKFWDRRPDIPEVWWRHIRVGVGNISQLVTIKTSLLDTILAPPQKPQSNIFKSLSKDSDPSIPSMVPPTFHHSWSPLPRRPVSLMELTGNQRTKNAYTSYSNILMASFECNAPNTIGYSALFDHQNLIGIVSHKRGEDMKMMREQLVDIEKATLSTSSPAPPYWVYMPIDEGEFILDIVCRPLLSSRVGNNGSICSMGFSTNKGRVVEFGYHGIDWASHRRVRAARLADAAAGKPAPVWFNQCDALPNRHSAQLLAFEEGSTSYLMDTGSESWYVGPKIGDAPTPTGMLPGISGPKLGSLGEDKPPRYLFGTPELREQNKRLMRLHAVSRYSHCSLTEVRHIEVAFDDNFFGDRIVTGLLLRYADGRHEAVGSFRPDRVDRSRGPINVGPDDYLIFKFVGDTAAESEEGVCRWVGNVACHEYFPGKTMISHPEGVNFDENGQEDESLLNVTQKGTLAWCVFGWRDRLKWFPDVESRLGKRLHDTDE